MEGSSVLPDSWSLSLFPDIIPDSNSNLPDLDIWTSSLMFPVSATFPNNQKRSEVREEVRQVFSCGKCGQRFQHLKSLRRHEASTTGSAQRQAVSIEIPHDVRRFNLGGLLPPPSYPSYLRPP